ncbi:pLS20_p028 family conjugation system transmembrane protein [Clostridium perfringens]|uniref:pLS20_p028 family conjugation system transmembrane protein n=1 Tax=Clostridium perfringens TaxID=1502 RepID=UPI003C302636
MTALINKFKPLLGLLLVASIIFIGYQLMINKKFDRSRVPMNIILALCIVVAMPLAMDKLNTLSNKVIGEIQGDVPFAEQIIENNITDLYLLDKANFPIKDDGTVGDISPKNNLGNNNIKISPNEEIDTSKVKNKKVFENEIVFDSAGKPTLNKIVGLFKWDDEYYRFHINFFTIILTLLITAFVMVFTAIKMIKLSIELAFSKVMTTFVAVADLSGGQRIRQSINGIMSIFVAMISTMLMLKLYILGTAYLSDKISGIGTVLAMIGCAIFVIDGPNYIEKMFGVDAGLSSVWRTITGINSALDILGKLGNATSEMAKNLGEGILGGLSFAKGMADEAMNSSLEDQMENAKKKDGGNEGDSLENQMKNKGFTNDDSPIVDVDFEEVDDSKENEGTNGLDEDVNSENSESANETLNGSMGEDDGISNQSTLEDEMNANNSVEKQDDNNVSGNQELSNNSDNSSSESSNQTLEDDINEANNNNINGNETLGDTNNSIEDGSSSLESEIENSNLNSETPGMNNLDTESLGVDDGGIESQLDDGSSINESIEDNLNNGNIGSENLDNNNIDSTSKLGNEDISSQEKIDDKVDEKAKEEVEMNNPNIGYENPVENRNIYDVLKGKLTGNEALNDTRIKLGRSYEIGKNTTRDINKFINKKKKGDKK